MRREFARIESFHPEGLVEGVREGPGNKVIDIKVFFKELEKEDESLTYKFR